MRLREMALALIVVGIVLVSTVSGARAQMDQLRSTTPDQRAKIQTDLMKSKLGLTADQTPKIAAINLKYARQMDPIIKSSERPFAKFRQMREISSAKEAELQQVLTPAQFQKYLDQRGELREQFEERLMDKAGS
jgi:hypothetical protein